MIEIINNLFTEEEVKLLLPEIEKGQWGLLGNSNKNKTGTPVFWYKDIFHTKATELFHEKISNGIKRKIVIDRLYVNGQAHSQCGFWHRDAHPDFKDRFTIVYFNKAWLPEYGGHLLIKSDNVYSILPEYNKAVLFDSTLEHMGMEPTVFCKTQRESIACKFRVINE